MTQFASARVFPASGTAGVATNWYDELFRRQPTLTAFTFVIAAMTAPTLLAMALEVRTFNGINVWLKPFKFELSMVVHLATLAWFCGYIDQAVRDGRAVRLMAWVIGLIFVAELTYIAYRAGYVEGSHYNTSTRAAAIAYPIMGSAILLVMVLTVWVGVLVFRSTEGGISSTLRLSIGLGLIAGSILGGFTGAYMSSHTGHWVGGAATDAGGVSLFGWSRRTGDLRVAHFIGLHAIQGIPIVGYFAQHVRSGRAVVWASVAIWTALTAFTLFQAIQARPFLPL